MTGELPGVMIRPYQHLDRQAVFRLAADTAFFGEPLETYLDDRQLFCDIFYRYYTDLESEHGWVACADEQVVGYLMGCVDTAIQRRLWLNQILPGTALGILRGKYKIGERTWRYTWRLAEGALRGESVHVDTVEYPAHLHLNVQTAWRRHGLGRRLIEAFLSQLRQLGIPGVHLRTTSLNTAAGRLYEKMGFQVVDQHLSQQWSGLAPGKIFNLCYALKLR
jgi:ribosomal protein S18 acetylase RimI-like enzyme